MGKLIGICTRAKTKAPMIMQDTAIVSFSNGVGNDSRGKRRNKRQVTIISNESWENVCEEMGSDIHWTTRRANLLVIGLQLMDTKGQYLKVGEAILKITGECEPCQRMDDQFDGLTKALTPEWRGGVTCELIEEGQITNGDQAEFIDYKN